MRRQVRYQLYAFSPFYRRVFEEAGLQVSGFRDSSALNSLPTVGRETLLSAPQDFLLTPTTGLIQRYGSGRQLREVFVDRLVRGIEGSERELDHEYAPVLTTVSQGTSGSKVAIKLTRRDLASLATSGSRTLEVAGAKQGDVVLNALAPGYFGFWTISLGAMAAAIDHRTSAESDQRDILDAVRDAGASVVCAPAEGAAVLAGGKPRLPDLRLVIVAGEVPAGLRDEASHLSFIGTYGFTEGRALWPECAEAAGSPDAGYHVFNDLEIVETGTSRGFSKGEISVTGLDHRGTALLRYRPGDVALGGLATGPCPFCGRAVDRIVGPILPTRDYFEIRTSAGQVGLGVPALLRAFERPGVSSWRLEISSEGIPGGEDELTVLYEPTARADPGKVGLDLSKSLEEHAGITSAQFVVSPGATGGVVDLRAGDSAQA